MNRQLPVTDRDTRIDIIKSVTNKIISPTNVGIGNASRIPQAMELAPIVQSKINDINVAEQIFDVMPDLEQVAEIATASILSTKDLMTTTVTYDASSKGLSVELRDRLLMYISAYFRDEYGLQDHLYDIVKDTLFITGSYAVGIIPESSVDRIINGAPFGKVATEEISDSEFKNIGILGTIDNKKDQSKFGLEAISDSALSAIENVIDMGAASISICDNPNVLKIPRLIERQSAHKIMEEYRGNALGSLLSGDDDDDDKEDVVGLENLHINRGMYKNPNYQSRTVEEVHIAEEAGRPTVGHPLTMHFPSESVIPIHVPGNIKIHVGYLVLLDNLGNPVSREELASSNIVFDKSKYKTEDAATMGLIEKMNPSAISEPGKKDEKVEYTKVELTKMFTDIVEGKLMNALKNGTYGENAMLSTPTDVYRIMMARALKKKSSQLLYIPSEQMAYYAIGYNQYGQGRSVLDRGRMLVTIRTALAYSTMRATILNSTENREYSLELDPEDLTPDTTIAKFESRIRQGFNGDVPYTGGPHDVIAYMGNSGVSLNITGSEHYPSTKLTVTDNSPDYKVPDSDIDEQYARRMYRMMGVDPDLILSPENIEFASQIVTKDLFTSRHITKTQEVIGITLTNFTRSYIMSDGILIGGMKDIINGMYKDVDTGKPRKKEVAAIIQRFVAQFTATLPPPDTGGLLSMHEQFTEVKGCVEELMEVFITDDALGEIDTEVDVTAVRDHVVNNYLRSWIKKNNVDQDILQIFGHTDEESTEYIRGIAKDNKDIATFILRTGNGIKARMDTVARKHGTDGNSDNIDEIEELPTSAVDEAPVVEPEVEEPEAEPGEPEADAEVEKPVEEPVESDDIIADKVDT